MSAAKGVYHLQYLCLRLSMYWKDQAMIDTNVALPEPNAIMKKIETSEAWEPLLSKSLQHKLKLPELCRLGKAGGSGNLGGGSVSGLTHSTGSVTDMSSITGSSGSAALTDFLKQLAAAGGSMVPGKVKFDGGGGGSAASTSNPSFNEVLFGRFKSMKVDGKPVKSRDICQKI